MNPPEREFNPNSDSFLIETQGKLLINEENLFLVIMKVFCIALGSPLNGFFAIALARDVRLYGRPRRAFLLSIALSNLLACLTPSVELAYYFSPSEALCRFYMATVGVPYAIFFFNVLLALLDRYAAIVHPIWHRRHVTVVRAAVCQVVGATVLIVITKLMYIVGWVPLKCGSSYFTTGWLAIGGWCIMTVTLTALFVSCIAVHLVLYRHTKTLSQRGRTLVSVRAELDVDESNKSPNSNQLRVHVAHQRVSRMEVKATQTLIIGVTSLFVIACPVIVILLSVTICRTVRQDECAMISWLLPYFKELCLVHAVINPIMFCVREKALLASFLKHPKRNQVQNGVDEP